MKRSHRPLTDQVVVVTGAASGVGEALARQLAEQGAKTALLDIDPVGLERVSAANGDNSRPWVCDVSQQKELHEVASAVRDHYGRVDAVVANAGIAKAERFADFDTAEFGRIIEINLMGSVFTARAFLPHLLESKGYLLQVASLAALAPTPFLTAYGASKAGVEAFAHALRIEVHHQGVDVGILYLGWTATPMVVDRIGTELLKEIKSHMPWPFNKTQPLEPAIARIVDGIARRAPYIATPGWVTPLRLIRGVMPTLSFRAESREVRRLAERDAAAV